MLPRRKNMKLRMVKLGYKVSHKIDIWFAKVRLRNLNTTRKRNVFQRAFDKLMSELHWKVHQFSFKCEMIVRPEFVKLVLDLSAMLISEFTTSEEKQNEDV